MIALNARLPGLLRGEDRPAGAPECVDFARLCSIQGRYATSARLWAEAFSDWPGLADDLRAENRSRAARAAALAGCGQGQDDPAPDADSRARLRQQALDWLKADLTDFAKGLETTTAWDRFSILKKLGRWRVDPALARLREESALSQLSEPERRSWQKFWSDLEALQKRAMRLGQGSKRAHPS
jgi:hypothetical protein